MDALLADPELASLPVVRLVVHSDPNPALPEAIHALDADLIVAVNLAAARTH